MTTNRLRGLLLALVASLALATPVGAAAQTEPIEPAPVPLDPAETDPTEQTRVTADKRLARTRAKLRRQIRKLRKTTWHWQRVMQRPRTNRSRAERHATSIHRLREVRDVWRKRKRRAAHRARRPPHRAAWRCIHRHEGPWNDPNAPYYGGLQMDLTFQRLYGRPHLRRKGTADRWTPLEQMWAAERAYRSGRGFHPWPNTARYCGLI